MKSMIIVAGSFCFAVLFIMTPMTALSQEFQFRLGPVTVVFPEMEDWPNDDYRRQSRRRVERRRKRNRVFRRQNRSYYQRKARVQQIPRPRRQTIPGPKIVEFYTNRPARSILISTKMRRLYYIISDSEAIEYPVAVGKEGFEWSGKEKVTSIKHWPSWRPPVEMRQRDPSLPVFVSGGKHNPLGAAAIYLGDTLYRIHGTNEPRRIGQSVSSGCIRMHNSHVLHLLKHVEIGTLVTVE